MPTYDYRCTACGHTFDELQKFSDPVLTKCPACKKNKLERLFGGGGAIIFKGGGFYETDYRRAGEKPEAAETGGSESKETKSEAPAADSAPKAEPKSESKGEKKSGGAKKKDK
ncbi:MAG TPA: zinc ribbon domain-containing protein [Gemmata sp.]